MKPAGAATLLLLAAGLLIWSAAQAAEPKKNTVHGAIAVNRDTQALGYAYDFKTASEARHDALKRCGDRKCEVVASFKNGCAAVATRERKLTSAPGTTRDEAETKALRKCGKDCSVLAWACTKSK
jgi:hypothetical protein